MKLVKRILKIVGIIIVTLVLAFGGLLLFSTITDYKPPEKEQVAVEGQAILQPDSIHTFMIWNIGYGGLGKEVDFFYDGGKTVRAPREIYDKDINGVYQFLQSNDSVDFFLLQEVDRNSKRSYRQDQFAEIGERLQDFTYSFGMNYNVKFIPIPPTNPLGKVVGGLASYSRFSPTSATRFSFPGNFAWPKRIYFLDRCFLVKRFDLPNGKELLVINTHNSAYDDGGLKKKQMEYLKNFLIQEYEKGNYVIVGGDWNQCPPNFDVYKFAKEDSDYAQLNIDFDYLPSDWLWAYDPDITTNRKLTTAYNPAKTFATIIDFYLISPNIELLRIKGIDQGFEFSDHQPVFMKVRLL
jgi:endonuclease/exonuclease/phosphatase family metal-dependent hydrolase